MYTSLNWVIIGSGNGLAPSHYLNQWFLIVNWILRNKSQWNLNQNTKIFIEENPFENVVCKMAAILFRPQCVSNVTQLYNYIKYRIKILITACKSNLFPNNNNLVLFSNYLFTLTLSGIHNVLTQPKKVQIQILYSLWQIPRSIMENISSKKKKFTLYFLSLIQISDANQLDTGNQVHFILGCTLHNISAILTIHYIILILYTTK